jgi:3-isopropylmalate/(R)-2-methylmalate dehydratase large subunit
MIQKIMARASGQADAPTGSVVVCEIDRVVLIDLQFRSFNSWRMPVRIADPARVAVILDHAVPAPSIADANAHEEARTFARTFGVSDFFDIGQHGICHQVIAEQGLARPGEMLVCADSHTCAGGAFNCAARGLGPLEILQVLCTGKTWFVVPETVRYTLTGSLGEDTSAKDLFLYLAAVHGEHSENRAIEFAGPGVGTLAMHDRRVLATQGIELLAEFTLFPYDDSTNRYLPADRRVDAGVESDPDAEVAFTAAVDLGEVVPHIGLPDGVVANAVPVTEVGTVPVTRCFIGSCANGQLEDLADAARILKGRTVSPGCQLVVTPASQRVFSQALSLGYVQALVDAGAVVTNPACGACFGYDLGVLGDNEVCLTASTRNFKGRMGSAQAQIFMASPATVAASALTGCITDPRGAR